MNTGLRQRLNVEEYLTSAERYRTIVERGDREVIFSRGDDADSLMYVLKGVVQLSVPGRRTTVVGLMGSGDCFGEECLAGHAIRKWTATAMTRSIVLVVGKAAMGRLLRTKPVLAQRFMTHLLSRRMQVEDDLIDQLHSSCEQRLARTLLTLAGYGPRRTRKHIVPRMSQETLAGIVGDTRSRINYFLQKFQARGFIEMDGSLIVHRSLRCVVAPVGNGYPAGRPGSRPVPVDDHDASVAKRSRRHVGSL